MIMKITINIATIDTRVFTVNDKNNTILGLLYSEIIMVNNNTLVKYFSSHMALRVICTHTEATYTHKYSIYTFQVRNEAR